MTLLLNGREDANDLGMGVAGLVIGHCLNLTTDISRKEFGLDNFGCKILVR